MSTFTSLITITNTNENFVAYMILFVILIILVAFIVYIFHIKNLNKSECNYMNDLYSNLDSYIQPITTTDADCSGNLYDYYIKTAYNSCSGGSYTNNYVDVCNLKSVLKQGVRCLDFEIYSIDNNPVVATSILDSYYIKQTFNYVDFSDVMNVIQNYGFASGTSPNPTDPIIIHLRCMSENQTMYTNLANVFASYDTIMLGKEYSFENNGENIGSVPLTSFMGKCILVIDKENSSFLENQKLLEYVNLVSNSVFMRAYNYTDVANNQDVNELTEYNKRCMTIVFPDTGANPANPSGILCMEYGCQMVAMRYQLSDNNLQQNISFFDQNRYAFVLKPARLRFEPVLIDQPVKQNPDYSYGTRNVSTDYYNYNF
jgi:hypothetical protein